MKNLKNNDRETILDLVNQKTTVNFSSYHETFIENQIKNHKDHIGIAETDQYIDELIHKPDLVSTLISFLTINVSCFFRNPFVFEFINAAVLPELITQKKDRNYSPIRVWSAGCSFGEEAYSIAILLMDAIVSKEIDFDLEIFATDIDSEAINEAKKALYSEESVKNIKFQWLKKYFEPKDSLFQLNGDVRGMVNFSEYDLLDQKHYVPKESIFGNFDITFCRNVLIYFQKSIQHRIFSNMYRALTAGGYLVLGEYESIPSDYENKFKKLSPYSKIYQKIKY